MSNFKQDFSNYTIIDSQPSVGTATIAKKFMANVFAWMFVALGVSTLMAVLFTINPQMHALLFEETIKGMHMTGLGTLVSFLPIIFVLVMAYAFARFSAPMLTLFFILYAATFGMSMSVLLMVYTTEEVV